MEECGDSGESGDSVEDSAELELLFVDIPAFDQTVERGGWNAQGDRDLLGAIIC